MKEDQNFINGSINDDGYDETSIYEELEKEKEEKAALKERKLQEAILKVKGKYGKNAILKGTNYREGATGRERNRQVGGHKE